MTPRALVVGAGPAGLSAATRLASWCGAVLVVDLRAPDHAHRAGEHVPPAGLSELTRVGLSELLSADVHDPSPGVRSAWGDDRAVDKDYFFTAPGRGLNLRRPQFDRALADRARRRGVTLQFGIRVLHVERRPGGYRVRLRGRGGVRIVDAEIVVDATGRRAAVARRLGATPRRYDDLIGVVGRIRGCAPGDEVGQVQVESVRGGWWYGLQFSCGTLVAAFMTDARRLPGHGRGALGLWLERLPRTTLVAALADGGTMPDRVAVFDASTQLLEGPLPTGFLAVGDAAAAYDPLSSWGITKAVCDGDAGAVALGRAHAGDPEAVAGHRAEGRAEFAIHRRRQSEFYRAETRWPASPFWRVRQGVLRDMAS